MLRKLAERLSRGAVLTTALPKSFGHYPIIVSPDARLGFLRRDIEGMDPDLLSVARELVQTGDVVWDVGCNVGVFAMAAAARSGPTGHVLAMDGDTWLVDLVRRSCALGSDPRAPIEVLPVAVDEHLSVASFNIAERGRAANFLDGTGSTQAGGVRAKHRVIAVTLDWLLEHFSPPRIVKIDVEGAESRLFKGAPRLLREVRPTFICEVASTNAEDVSRILTREGYSMFDMHGYMPATSARIGLATNNVVAIPEKK